MERGSTEAFRVSQQKPDLLMPRFLTAHGTDAPSRMVVRKRRCVKDLIQIILSHTTRSRHITWTLRSRLVMERMRPAVNGLRLFQRKRSGGSIGNITGGVERKERKSGGAFITGASMRSGMRGDRAMLGEAKTSTVKILISG